MESWVALGINTPSPWPRGRSPICSDRQSGNAPQLALPAGRAAARAFCSGAATLVILPF
jgi:hypothetical protein